MIKSILIVIEVIVWIFTVIFASSIIIYYADIIMHIAFEIRYARTKKEFKKCFIPYYVWIKKIKDFYNKLEE